MLYLRLMIYAVCGLIFGLILVKIGLFLLSVRALNRFRDDVRLEITETIRVFIEAPDSATPSPFAVLIDTFATLFASRALQQVKQMLSGIESKAGQAEQLEMFSKAAEGNPWLGLIAGMVPKRVRNSLIRNPQMMAALSKIGTNHKAAPSAPSAQSAGDD